MPTPTPARKATTTKKAPAKKAPAKKAPARKATPDYVALAAAYITTNRMARPRGWDRTALLAILATWSTLPTYGPEALSAEGRARGLASGWSVPADCFTPGKAVDQSAVNSVRAYIRDVAIPALAAVGCPDLPTIDHVATMWEGGTMVVYRRA